jgi:hypothetical protein
MNLQMISFVSVVDLIQMQLMKMSHKMKSSMFAPLLLPQHNCKTAKFSPDQASG